MSSALLPVYERDLTLVKGKGSRLWDKDGREWLDFAAGIAVNGFGYGDRKIVAAIRKQAGTLIHASNLYHNEPASALAERLVRLAFPSKVFFTNSGTEAWEGAMKFARRIGKDEGRTEYVAFEHSFHGRSMGALSTTWTAKFREPFEPLVPGVRFVPRNDLAAMAAAVGDRTAAVMIEPERNPYGTSGPAVSASEPRTRCRHRPAVTGGKGARGDQRLRVGRYCVRGSCRRGGRPHGSRPLRTRPTG